jgi:sarcosine oxidase gamma subunit
VDDAVSTVAAHVGITLWRLEDDEAGSAVFELAVFRSLATSLWHALTESAAEFGIGADGARST